MKTKSRSRLPIAILASISLPGVLAGLGGCAFVEAQLQRVAPPDDRIELGWQQRVSLSPRDVVKYTCDSRHALVCDRGGAITFSCTCVLR
jgi:hypothetical protein